jgi:valyl-tRNA synthetase
MGHALNNSLQDLLIRYKRMSGFKTLWIPGTDHAGIATQNVVERELKKEGKRKEDLGRDKFIEKVWEWKKEYGGKITAQLRRLGSSCDWSRERFTMDEGLCRAVNRHFVQLYNEGLIYRGKRIINWCPRCQTALSDIEVEHEEKNGNLWHIRYPGVEGGEVIVATTRPETLLGDTAVAVNPKDERYKNMWRKMVELPLVGRRIPIIKDDFVDPAFGTGAVKVTPAHDPNDYEMGHRHNLPFINILTPDGRLTLKEFSEEEQKTLLSLEGLDRQKVRSAVVKMLEEQGLLVKIEDYKNAVGGCYRCKTVIEPYLSDQWFVKVGPLAAKGIAAVESGEIKFVPERWNKVYLQWMTNLRDWCISRQLWWGHRIPAWYRGEELYVGETPPSGEGWVQDEDVFDTWFSSALWPFSTLGWPEETADLKTYYPTDVLVTSYDIISFWVARMIMSGLHFMKQVPFHTVYIHGLVKDIHGKKMSKSWGNVIDPLEVIEKAGADALRFAFISLVAGQGQDIKLAEDKITEARNFANKIWNASRFVLMNIEGKLEYGLPAELGLADRWIVGRLELIVADVGRAIDQYDFGQAARQLYSFIWGEFCDWYLEIAKISLYSDQPAEKQRVLQVLTYALEKILRLLHPFMPFITEEIWQRLADKVDGFKNNTSISIAPWPEAKIELHDPASVSQVEYIQGLVTAIRNVKANYNVATKEIPATLAVATEEKNLLTPEAIKIVKVLARVPELTLVEALGNVPKPAGLFTAFSARGYLPLAGLIDTAKERTRLQKDKDKLDQEIVKLKSRLASPDFLERAGEGTVEREKAKLEEFSAKSVTLSEQLGNLEG